MWDRSVSFVVSNFVDLTYSNCLEQEVDVWTLGRSESIVIDGRLQSPVNDTH